MCSTSVFSPELVETGNNGHETESIGELLPKQNRHLSFPFFRFKTRFPHLCRFPYTFTLENRLNLLAVSYTFKSRRISD